MAAPNFDLVGLNSLYSTPLTFNNLSLKNVFPGVRFFVTKILRLFIVILNTPGNFVCSISILKGLIIAA